MITMPATARHALQGLLHLASLGPGAVCLVAAAARARRLPAGALAKTFQRLAHHGLLEARRGPGGGYRLARSPRSITAAEIVAAARDAAGPDRCLMEDRPCGEPRRCMMHDALTGADRILTRRLESMTLFDLAAREASAEPGQRKGGTR